MYLRSSAADSTQARHDTLIAKIVAMVVLLVATVLCGALPFLLNRCFKWTAQSSKSNSSIFINFMLQLSGGVLFATTFVHLLPEVHDVVDHLDACKELPELPFVLSETLMCAGFFLIYLIESFIDLYMEKRAAKAAMVEKSTISMMTEAIAVATDATNTCECQHSHGQQLNASKSLRGLLIVLALSLHEVFEGMAIGLEQRSNSVWLMFAGVSAHKLVLAFCLGVEIIVVETPRLLAALYVILFAIITPIGIGMGILLSHNGVVNTSSLAAAILQGLACGTLLYVVFFEVLKSHRTKLSSLLAIFIGFAIMFGLQMFDDDGDNEDAC